MTTAITSRTITTVMSGEATPLLDLRKVCTVITRIPYSTAWYSKAAEILTGVHEILMCDRWTAMIVAFLATEVSLNDINAQRLYSQPLATCSR